MRVPLFFFFFSRLGYIPVDSAFLTFRTCSNFPPLPFYYLLLAMTALQLAYRSVRVGPAVCRTRLVGYQDSGL